MLCLLVLSLLAIIVAGDETSCSTLAGSKAIGLNNTALTNSTWVPVGAKNVSGTLNSAAFCQVFGVVSYVGNNSVVFETWLPNEHMYNGRFVAVGKDFISKWDTVSNIAQGTVEWRELSTKMPLWRT